MRLVDVVLRRGHLSEETLIETVMTGERPVHLDRCDICADRAVEIGRWLDEVHTVGIEAADAVFPPERLAAQQSQILRRLEQLDQPSRVIAFPNQQVYAKNSGSFRVAPAWLGVAAAAGVALGLFSSQLTGQFLPAAQEPTEAITTPAAAAAPTRESLPSGSPGSPIEATLIDQDDLDRVHSSELDALEKMTPTSIGASIILASNRSIKPVGR